MFLISSVNLSTDQMKTIKRFLWLSIALAQVILSHAAPVERNSGIAYIRSGDETLPGYYYRPEGKGPFPVVIFVRAASRPITQANPPLMDLARSFTDRGYAFVVPCWQLPAEMAAERAKDLSKKNGQVSLPEFHGMARQVAAAVTWAKSQGFVDENRVSVIGHASGAILSLLLAEQEIGVRSYIAFSPAAVLWKEREDLQQAFVNSIRETKAPIFLIQAQNDFTLTPSQVLGKELSRRHDLSLSKVYPPFGTSHEHGNNFALAGSSVWSDDVFKFLQRTMN